MSVHVDEWTHTHFLCFLFRSHFVAAPRRHAGTPDRAAIARVGHHALFLLAGLCHGHDPGCRNGCTASRFVALGIPALKDRGR